MGVLQKLTPREREGRAEDADADADDARFEALCRHRSITAAGFRPFGDAIAERVGPDPDLDPSAAIRRRRILDVGCGFGDTTLALASGGTSCVGVDVDRRLVAAAIEGANTRGHASATFLVADAGRDPLGGPFDAIVSRFGAMFFRDPIRAFTHLHGELLPNGRLAMSVWRDCTDNPFISDVEAAARLALGLPPAKEPRPGHAGPFGLADPELVDEILTRAGFGDVDCTRLDADRYVGRDLDEAVNHALDVGAAADVLALAGATAAPALADVTPAERRTRVAARIRDVLAPHARREGIFVPASAWIVTAVRGDRGASPLV